MLPLVRRTLAAAAAALLAALAAVPALGQGFTGLMSGSWWDASRAGEGQFITFETVGARYVAYLAYFTYTPDGVATWHVGNADYAPGATSVTFPLVTGTGPRFGAAFRPADLATASAGTATLEYVSCGQLRLRHSGMPGLTLNLTRLVGPLAGHPCSESTPTAVAVSGLSPFPAGCGGAGGTLYPNAEVEPSLAANPANPDHLLAMWQQDRWSNGSARGLVSAVSFDGGASWTARPMAFSRCGGGAATNGGDFDRATDPWVSFGPDGTAWAMGLSTTGPANAMLVARSSDGGRTWGSAVPLIADTTGFFNDKNTLTADPFDSRFVYAVWDRLADAGGGPAMFARTVDAGATWEPARAIFDPGRTSQTIGNLVVVPAGGELVNVALQIDAPANAARTAWLIAMRSVDRGQTWSEPVRIANFLGVGARDPETGATIRDGAVIPQAAAGPGGTLHVVWQDARFSGGARDSIAYSRSSDGGLTWSAPVRVNPNPAVAAFTPTVHVLADGTIGITYFDLRDNTAVRSTLPAGYFLARSGDGGLTWTETRLAGPFDLATAPVANGLFLGDYMGLSGSGTAFLSLFVRTTGSIDNRNDVYLVRAAAGSAAMAQGKEVPAAGAWTARWTAQAAAPFVVDAAWSSAVDGAIGRALAARGRAKPPR